MKAISKANFKKAYGISDENFISFLDDRNCATFKSLSKYCDTNIISKKDMETVYNRYIYYKSIGLDDKTINGELKNVYREIIHKLNNVEIKKFEYASSYLQLNLFNSLTFLDDLIILSLDIEVKQAITGFGIACLYNLPVPYGVSELFLSDYTKIDSTGDIYFEEGTPAGTKIRKTITYRYE